MFTGRHSEPARCLRSSKPALSVLGVCLISVAAWSGASATDTSINGGPGHASVLRVPGPASAATSSRAFRWVVAAAETLDLADLERRLVDTKAIGFLSKLSLKGKMDGFVKDLRAARGGASEHTLEEMRERYDLLVHNVQTMLENKDPALAGDIAAARELMWKLLADVEQFEKTVGGMV